MLNKLKLLIDEHRHEPFECDGEGYCFCFDVEQLTAKVERKEGSGIWNCTKCNFTNLDGIRYCMDCREPR